jgi:hypothetical protein
MDNVDKQTPQKLRYYVEMTRSPPTIEGARLAQDANDQIENLNRPTCELKDEVQFFVNQIFESLCFANLLSLPYLPTRKQGE